MVLLYKSFIKINFLKIKSKLVFIGREYPAGAEFFRTRLRNAFRKNKSESDPKKIETLISRGEFVVKEIDALYKLKKYRHLKKSYYDEN